MSSRELSVVVVAGCWSSLCMAAVVSEWVEVIVVEGERGAEGVESDDPICMANNNIVVVVGVWRVKSPYCGMFAGRKKDRISDGSVYLI